MESCLAYVKAGFKQPKERAGKVRKTSTFDITLTTAVIAMEFFPTPCSRDWKDNGKSPAELKRNSMTLAANAGGVLNPDWVGWLMGFPIGWASLKATVTPKSHSKQQLPGDCSVVNEEAA
jgi:hypothetical protein